MRKKLTSPKGKSVNTAAESKTAAAASHANRRHPLEVDSYDTDEEPAYDVANDDDDDDVGGAADTVPVQHTDKEDDDSNDVTPLRSIGTHRPKHDRGGHARVGRDRGEEAVAAEVPSRPKRRGNGTDWRIESDPGAGPEECDLIYGFGHHRAREIWRDPASEV